MVKQLSLLVFLFHFNFLFAQTSDIKLPKGGEQIKVEQSAPIFRFYITKDQEVFFEQKRLRYFDEIASNLLHARRELTESWKEVLIKVYIYADVDVRYSFIECIKAEIANAASFSHVYLITEPIKNSENAILERIFFTGELKVPKPILTKRQEIISNEINEEIKDMPPPPAPPFTSKDELVYNIFTGNKKEVEKVISNFSIDFIILFNDSFSFESFKYSLSNTQKLKEIIEITDLLFIQFDDKLLYGDYINTIKTINNITAEIKQKDLKIYPRIVVMTKALEELLKKENIQIFHLKE